MKSLVSFMIFLMLSASVNASTIHVGDIVYGHNGNHLVGQVLKIFGNRKAEVNWLALNGEQIDSINYWDCSELHLKVECHDGFCEGDEVYGHNGNHLTGFIEKLFENGKAEVNWRTLNGDTIDSVNYWSTSELEHLDDSCGSCFLFRK